jgi:hypothetical protein
VDDNITLNVQRFEALCQAIIDAGLNDLEYTVQATTSAIANHGERLARLMREAGFRYVFLASRTSLKRTCSSSEPNPRTASARRSGNRGMRRLRPSSICIATR